MTSTGPAAPRMSAERTRQLRAAIMAETRTSNGRGRRPLAVAAVATTSVLVVGGTAAAWVAVSRPDDPNNAYCSAEASTDRGVWALHGVGTAVNADTGKQDRLNALEVCAGLWRAGVVREPGARPSPSGTYRVPGLVACVVDDQLVIYPGGPGVCGQLKVPAAEPN